MTLLYDRYDLCIRSERFYRAIVRTAATIHVVTSNIEFDASSMTMDDNAPDARLSICEEMRQEYPPRLPKKQWYMSKQTNSLM